jgi:hypothetical protein
VFVKTGETNYRKDNQHRIFSELEKISNDNYKDLKRTYKKREDIIDDNMHVFSNA